MVCGQVVQGGDHVVVQVHSGEAPLEVEGVEVLGQVVVIDTEPAQALLEGGEPDCLEVGRGAAQRFARPLAVEDERVDRQVPVEAGDEPAQLLDGEAKRAPHQCLEVPQGLVAVEVDRDHGTHRGLAP